MIDWNDTVNGDADDEYDENDEVNNDNDNDDDDFNNDNDNVDVNDNNDNDHNDVYDYDEEADSYLRVKSSQVFRLLWSGQGKD